MGVPGLPRNCECPSFTPSVVEFNLFPKNPSSRSNLAVAFRFALRELRGGLSGFGVFLACIVLGVAAIAAVGSVARGMNDSIAREGQTLIGGDFEVELVHRRAAADERAYLDELGSVSEVATLRAMARRADGEDQTLVELKAVDGAYPLYGELMVEEPAGRTLAADDMGGALVDPELLVANFDIEGTGSPGERSLLWSTGYDIGRRARPDRSYSTRQSGRLALSGSGSRRSR